VGSGGVSAFDRMLSIVAVLREQNHSFILGLNSVSLEVIYLQRDNDRILALEHLIRCLGDWVESHVRASRPYSRPGPQRQNLMSLERQVVELY
jgi:hypothetical protein